MHDSDSAISPIEVMNYFLGDNSEFNTMLLIDFKLI